MVDTAGVPPTASGQIEPVIEHPALALPGEDADIPPPLFAGSHDRHPAGKIEQFQIAAE